MKCVTSDNLSCMFIYCCLVLCLGNYALDYCYWMDWVLSHVCQLECNVLGNRLQNLCT